MSRTEQLLPSSSAISTASSGTNFGSAVITMRQMCIRDSDRFGQSGKAADVLREYGLTADQIAETVKAIIG